jgi:hypothetical protein
MAAMGGYGPACLKYILYASQLYLSVVVLQPKAYIVTQWWTQYVTWLSEEQAMKLIRLLNSLPYVQWSTVRPIPKHAHH